MISYIVTLRKRKLLGDKDVFIRDGDVLQTRALSLGTLSHWDR